jgi:hypothetical protein
MGMEIIENLKELIKKTKKELEQLQSQLPKHSIQPAMILQIEKLEDELVELNKKLQAEKSKD